MRRIRVQSGSGLYEILCGAGAIRRLASAIAKQRDVTGVFVLSSPRVWRNCGKRVANALKSNAPRETILFDDSERAKTLRTVENISRALHRARADRRSVVVAVGGGVAGDVSGFVAASYLRGVRLIHVPTTLIAQVDSSIGGKTGVNLREGKNLVGAFYPPVAVVSDPVFLSSLPDSQFRSGLYEVVKCGVIGDAKLFGFLEANMAKVLRRNPDAIAWVSERAIQLKTRIVSKDEHEAGLRQVLNFGHTFGHALEAAARYRKYLHGEAIAWGMLVATLLALATERLSLGQAERIVRAVVSVGALPSIEKAQIDKLLDLMQGDKKSRGGQVRWVLPAGIGRVEWGVNIPTPLMREAIAQVPELARLGRASI